MCRKSNGFTEAEDDDDSIAFETLTIAENIQADGTANQVRLAEAGFLVNGSANSDEDDVQLDRYIDGTSDENLLEVRLTFDEAVELGSAANGETSALAAARAVFELRDGATAGTSRCDDRSRDCRRHLPPGEARLFPIMTMGISPTTANYWERRALCAAILMRLS